MKASAKFAVLSLTAAILGMISVFAKPLGIPAGWDLVPIGLGLVFIWLGYRQLRIARAAGEVPHGTESQKRTRFLLLIVVMTVTCASIPFVLPFTGTNLPLEARIAVSGVTFVICMGLLWLSRKRLT